MSLYVTVFATAVTAAQNGTAGGRTYDLLVHWQASLTTRPSCSPNVTELLHPLNIMKEKEYPQNVSFLPTTIVYESFVNFSHFISILYGPLMRLREGEEWASLFSSVSSRFTSIFLCVGTM